MGGSKKYKKLYLKYVTLKLEKEVNLQILIRDLLILSNIIEGTVKWNDLAETLLNCEVE